jgi:predicted transcriptional regulator
MSDNASTLQELVAEVAAAYFSNSPVSVSDISSVIAQIASSLANVGAAVPAEAPAVEDATAESVSKLTAAQIRKSVTPAALISFEDGRPYKTLKRHLAVKGLTPQTYKEKWGLPADYPMVSPNYSAARSEMARSLGLGQKGRQARASTPALKRTQRRKTS